MHTFGAGDETRFHHVVATVTLGAGGSNSVSLYVNAGAPVATLGAENFTGDGERAFLNAVNFMLGNAGTPFQIVSIEYDLGADEITLTWTSTEGRTYTRF